MGPGQMNQARISGQSGAADAAPNLNGLFTLRRKSRVREHKDRARPHVPLTSVADTAAGSSPSRARTRVERMKSAVAWNVKGVGADARETAREAARRAGLSVGEWLDSVIMESADETDGSAEDGDLSTIHQRLDALATRLGKLRSASRLRASDRRGDDIGSDLRGLEIWLSGITKDLARCGEETPQRVADAINGLNERLDNLIDSGRVAASEFGRRVRPLDELDGETRRTAFPFKRRTAPTEDVVSEIGGASGSEPGDEPDRRTDTPGWRKPTSELDRHLRTLTRQLDMMRRPCGFEDSVEA